MESLNKCQCGGPPVLGQYTADAGEVYSVRCQLCDYVVCGYVHAQVIENWNIGRIDEERITYETIRKYETPYVFVRVWREEVVEDLYKGRSEVLHLISAEGWANVAAHTLAKKLLALPRVSAVEVIDKLTTWGVVLYKDWPKA